MQSHLFARMISLPQLCATSSVQTDPPGLSHILTSLQHSHLIPAIASVRAKVSQIRQEPKNHPLNSIHLMPVHCVSFFSAQQHLFGIWTQGEPLKVLCEDEVRTPGCGTHTETQYPHRDMVPTPGCSARRGMQCPPHALPCHCQHPATPWHLSQPWQLLFRQGFVFTITLLSCGFLARPICLCSAAGGSLPSPKLHAGLYKRPRCLGCGEARAQSGSAAAQGRFR